LVQDKKDGQIHGVEQRFQPAIQLLTG
jgi:hypothetical protein